MFDDLDGLSDASGVPCVDGCDELGCLPVDLVVLDVRVLNHFCRIKTSGPLARSFIAITLETAREPVIFLLN